MITDGEALWEMGSIIIPFILGVWLGINIMKERKIVSPYKSLWEQSEKRLQEEIKIRENKK